MAKSFDGADLFASSFVGVLVMGIACSMLTCTSHSADTILAYEKLKSHKVPIVMTKSGEFWLWNEQAKFSQRVWESDIKTMLEIK